jgi:hypothetical protein
MLAVGINSRSFSPAHTHNDANIRVYANAHANAFRLHVSLTSPCQLQESDEAGDPVIRDNTNVKAELGGGKAEASSSSSSSSSSAHRVDTTKRPPVLTHVKALLWKRGRYFMRDQRAIVCQLILPTGKLTHTYTYTHIHTHTRTQAHTHTHTHTHTHRFRAVGCICFSCHSTASSLRVPYGA